MRIDDVIALHDLVADPTDVTHAAARGVLGQLKVLDGIIALVRGAAYASLEAGDVERAQARADEVSALLVERGKLVARHAAVCAAGSRGGGTA